MRILFIFIDGVGLGDDHPANPFVFAETPKINHLLEGRNLTGAAAGFKSGEASLLALDASLGVDGLPQSATGQTAIFTGCNAPAYLGRHLNGFPDQRLRKLLATRGIFRQLQKRNYKAFFANAYRPPFFDLLRRGLPGDYYSCSTLITYYGRLKFNSLDELVDGKALYMDVTNEILRRMGYDLPAITPESAAERLLRLSRAYDFTLFEYFLSDLAGHMSDKDEAVKVISVIDQFIGRLVELLNPQDELLIVTSDHGNLEDLSTGDHTTNPVPLLLAGNRLMRERVCNSARDITDIAPSLLRSLAGKDDENAD